MTELILAGGGAMILILIGIIGFFLRALHRVIIDLDKTVQSLLITVNGLQKDGTHGGELVELKLQNQRKDITSLSRRLAKLEKSK